MPPFLPPLRLANSNHGPGFQAPEREADQISHVFATREAEETIAELHNAITNESDPTFSALGKYLRDEQQSRIQAFPLSVCFKSVSTYGRPGGTAPVKTLKDAIWRTLTFQDVYEWTFIKRVISPAKVYNGQALIRDFSGVVRNGEVMLVLGNPGAGCSTFLRTIGNDHSSFLGVKGCIDYSGLSPDEILKRFRGAVSYVPEDDIHLPTLTDEFGRAFGMTQSMDTLVGNEFIRGISGGERKRISILESLTSGASVQAWDGSTRGLDASSALDYIKSLRLMTDACRRATIVSLYQASDTIFNLMDKVMLIGEGRMLYQGPAKTAEAYFSALGYDRLPRQTMSDFLTSIASGNVANIRRGYDSSAPRFAVDLEQAFRASQAFKDVQNEIHRYEIEVEDRRSGSQTRGERRFPMAEALKQHSKQHKSKYVAARSSYNTSFFRQVLWCARREFWQLNGHRAPFISKFVCIFVCAFLLSSMFYDMPDDTDGVYSRGGFCFYAAGLVSWFQLGELEGAFSGRAVVSRQKRYAMVRPSAVVVAKTLMDIPTVFLQTALFSLIAYFLSGLRLEASSFFAVLSAIFLCTMAYTASFRVFAAVSPHLEVALRYCGIFTLVTMACGGYLRPIDRLMSDVPWVGWLGYLTPAHYTFEILMVVEFRGREFPCGAGSIIPAGPDYNDPSFQACATRGISSGQLNLNGDHYVKSEFGFSFENIGRNYGILVLFLVALCLLNMWLVENVDWVRGRALALEYAHNIKAASSSQKCDEESADELRVHEGAKPESTTRQVKRYFGRSGVTFSWRDINYNVRQHSENKQLLRSVSGFCKPGSLTALVGSSGAGKSTLMTVLSQQGVGTVTGEMKIDGEKIGPSFGRRIGFCQQMDIHLETSTVREAFEFSALLRQSSKIRRRDKIAYVAGILKILDMSDLQNMVIRSLSLEQKKRTTIGVELCANPDLLLFLDEPTSGLDGQGAISIIKLLRRLADAGQAILCTIHQASQEQFELFDRVLALNRGGRVYYFGDIGIHGSTVIDYFAQHGVAAESNKNVADLLIEVTARESTDTARDWCQIWQESDEAAAVLETIDTITTTIGEAAGEHDTSALNHQYASSTYQQILLLTKRTLLQYWRTPDYIYSRLYCSFAHSALNGLIFLQLGNTQADLQYRIFSCFLVLMIIPEFINACAMMFDDNRNVWLGREYPSRIYGWVAFATANVVAEIPYALVGAVLFYVLFYFIVGLSPGTPAGYTFLMIVMFHLFSTSWGQWIVALSTDATMAANIMPFFVVMCEFFNGVLQPKELMPAVWRYTMYYIGPFTYWISGVITMILAGVHVRCSDSELIRFNVPSDTTCGEYANDWLSGTKGYLENPDAFDDCGYCQYAAGQDYLLTISLTSDVAWPYLGIFALFTVTNYALVYVFLYIKSVKNWLPW
ncbi:ABC-2 type transporter-domain-containing protein [Dactylonectria estremocensis]|uniref:ABC-2 type transporter-domain-containing protein n=1 Tax=Dactylonectria estremocensis TaxID=1079267 RepID=A0A9P9DAM4_9HYPO|nr:ABC-2 type transporter-domain-containing protein [Dactylonectria estremocensis]